jgi:hypothetical protein
MFSILSQKLLYKKFMRKKNIPVFSFPDFTYRIFSVYFYTVEQYRITINVPFFGAGRNDFDVGKLIRRAIRNRDFFGL